MSKHQLNIKHRLQESQIEDVRRRLRRRQATNMYLHRKHSGASSTNSKIYQDLDIYTTTNQSPTEIPVYLSPGRTSNGFFTNVKEHLIDPRVTQYTDQFLQKTLKVLQPDRDRVL